MEAFSDGVLAIIITIMVLELKIPHEGALSALRPLLPVFLSYGLSFIFLGIYWTNHHHLLYVTSQVNGAILWVNLHLLFWLSLILFVTGWMGENHFAPVPTAAYGVNLLLAGIAFWLLLHAILRREGPVDTGRCAREGLEGPDLSLDLWHRNPAGVAASVDCVRVVSVGRPPVAAAGSPNRAKGPKEGWVRASPT